jgi:hypothetical protein
MTSDQYVNMFNEFHFHNYTSVALKLTKFGSKMVQHHILLCTWTYCLEIKCNFLFWGSFWPAHLPNLSACIFFYGATWRVSICNTSGKLEWAQGSNYTRNKCYTTNQPVHVMENVSQATPSLNLHGRHLAGVIIRNNFVIMLFKNGKHVSFIFSFVVCIRFCILCDIIILLLTQQSPNK